MKRDRKRTLKKRGILLATAGWFLALAVILVMRLLELSQIRLQEWVALLVLTLIVQTALWLVVDRGLDARLRRDPHYLFTPMLAAAGLLSIFVYFAPEAASPLLMAWFVSLLFMAGLAGFRQVVVLSSFATLGHLAALALRAGRGLDLVAFSQAGLEVGVFFAICCYAGFVLQRVKADRNKLHELRREMAELAARDPLTGLPNRRRFEESIRAEVERSKRWGNTFSVAMLDVDHFKIYNDSSGHLAGDEVLCELAELLQEQLRDTDVATRYGGEEFGVILINTPLSGAHAVVERLRQIIEAHPFEEETKLPTGQLTISGGIAEFGPGCATYEELVEEADRALYDAKRAGRNRVCIAA